MDRNDFMEEHGGDYGYPNHSKSIDEIRATEFRRLGDLVYLDHAGATLYSESQIGAAFKELSASVYGNPHSQSDCGSSAVDTINDARRQVLNYCNAPEKDYRCVFTSGATAGLKLVGEFFPWSGESQFMYTMENHNSVVGIREYALANGAEAFAVDVNIARSNSPSHELFPRSTQRRFKGKSSVGEGAYSLFAFPSECNFSGVRPSLDLVNMIKDGDSGGMMEHIPQSKGRHWIVLIDAAKGCSTEPPDLSKHPVDFLVISFYKLFGYPTGLGALIARNEASKLLRKTYFSGGTVASCVADVDSVRNREGVEEMFEDGTVSFLSIASINHGFRILNDLTPSSIRRHTRSLSSHVRKMLSSLKHGNGARVCEIYGGLSSEEMGAIVTFNVKRSDGSWVGHREVEKMASLSRIQLRTGCFCNPGACAKYLRLSHDDLRSNAEDAGHVCWDEHDLVNGRPTGAVRVSFGYMSTFEDAQIFLEFMTESFVPPADVPDRPPSSRVLAGVIEIASIRVYPIKSCGGFSACRWPLCRTGLLHDREWVVRSPSGEVLTQKKLPGMSLITTSVDLASQTLTVESPHCQTKLRIESGSRGVVGGDGCEVRCYDTVVGEWFSRAVGRRCILCRRCSDGGRSDRTVALNFPNKDQFLLISEESVADLCTRLAARGRDAGGAEETSMRFRPNIVVRGGRPYAEDQWSLLQIGHLKLISTGGCNRCRVINHSIDGVIKSDEPLATLSTYRRRKGKILFGILLRYDGHDDDDGGCGDSWIEVGQPLHPLCD